MHIVLAQAWTPLQTIYAVLPQLFSIATPIAVAIYGIVYYREKRQTDLSEATTSWHQLCDAYKEKYNLECERVRQRDATIEQLKFRNEFLWQQIQSDRRLNKQPPFNDGISEGTG